MHQYPENITSSSCTQYTRCYFLACAILSFSFTSVPQPPCSPVSRQHEAVSSASCGGRRAQRSSNRLHTPSSRSELLNTHNTLPRLAAMLQDRDRGRRRQVVRLPAVEHSDQNTKRTKLPAEEQARTHSGVALQSAPLCSQNRRPF